jgi:L-alanine-DL-glutamate epimerase-like enolase superfamily enzyme
MKIVDIREYRSSHQIQNFKRVHRFQPDDGQLWRVCGWHPVQDSYVRLPDIPGVGFEAKVELYKLMKTLIEN